MRLCLAPLQGLTTVLYRNTFAKRFGGIDEYYSPFVGTAACRTINKTLLRDLFPERNSPAVELVPQLLGNDGHDFRRFADRIAEYGYRHFNWNIGCPFPTVTTKCKGSGILPFPERIDRFLGDAFDGFEHHISVKMRLGMESAEESAKVIDVLNRYPVKEVTVHARTGSQLYSGTVDLDAFGCMLGSLKHDAIYNGDIFTAEDYHRIISRFPSIKGVMLGRGVLADPFLPLEIKGQAFCGSERIARMKSFHDELYRLYEEELSGPKHLCDKMKGFWEYLAVHLDGDGRALKKIRKSKSLEDYDEAVHAFFDADLSWQENRPGNEEAAS